MSYNNCHRAFLQAIMERGAVNNDDARELIVKIFRQNEGIYTYVHKINQQLNPISMAIKEVTCELTGKKYWILVNTVLDEAARFQQEFSAAQLELLRKIFSEIITSPDGSAPSTQCLNLCSSLEHKMSKADAEYFLTRMVAKQWLILQHGKYFMGVRSLAELVPYFRTTYADDALNTCYLCKQVTFHGERCMHCQTVLHLYCFANCARVQNPPKCPSCNNIMPTDKIQGFTDLESYGDDTMNPSGMNSETVLRENNQNTQPRVKRKIRN